jgi:hypothetical protein
MTNQRIELYKHLRQVARNYLSGLVAKDKYPEIDPKAVGKLLGIYRDGTLIFESENDVSAMMDFSIAEKLYNGKSLIDREVESNQNLDEDKYAILEAYRSGYTSLFEVRGSDPAEHTIQLYDLLKDDDKEIIDINLSLSIDKSRLLFFRLVSFKDFAMTSGVNFVFNVKRKDFFLRRYRSELKTRFIIDKSITRFLIFHRLNHEFGQEIELL